MPLAIDDRVVDVPGGRCFVRRWTPGACMTDAPLVLLHDSLGSVEQWRDFPAALAARLQRPVLAYDRLGFGRSSQREDTPSREFIVDEARDAFPALRRALGFERFALFGHSVGGAMALVIAATSGAACEFVVSESAQAFVEERTRDGIRAAQVRFADAAHFARLQKWHGERARWVLHAWTDVWLDPAFANWSLDPWLPQVRCPVLVLHGDRDEFGSAAFPQRIAVRVRGPVECVVLADCGHVPHRERPEEIVGRVAAFAAGIGAGLR